MSIPYLSGHPFLPIITAWTRQPGGSVNPLSIGTPISTEVPESYSAKLALCQSPIYRDTHFYVRIHPKGMAVKVDCVNPLSIGTPISTTANSGHSSWKRNVSIPYLSGHPFLQRIFDGKIEKGWLCQSPIYRDTHFYFNIFCVGNFSYPYHCVNPLSIGTPISTA